MTDYEIRILETDGFTQHRLYTITSGDKVEVNKGIESKYQSVTKLFSAVFLPHGYPESVSLDYFSYQIWDSIQAFASSLTGSLSTHAVLKGVGVGDENASTLAATITWLIKDGVSMVGRIGFAWLQGTKLDSDCKKWRLFADVVNDLAMFLDLTSLYFKDHFLFIVCISGLMKSLVGVAGGCTRAALTQHQARRNNMADVSAKDGSQETLVNLVALLFSLLILPAVTQSNVLTWTMFLCMTMLHLVANYFAVKSVTMEVFNEARLSIVAEHFIAEWPKRETLSVYDVNAAESVFFQWPPSVIIHLGSSISDIIQGKKGEEIKTILEIYNNCEYLVRVSNGKFSRIHIHISFSPRASSKDIIESYYEASYIKHLFLKKVFIRDSSQCSGRYYEQISREFTLKSFPIFFKSITEMKFKTDIVFFDIDSWTAQWK